MKYFIINITWWNLKSIWKLEDVLWEIFPYFSLLVFWCYAPLYFVFLDSSVSLPYDQGHPAGNLSRYCEDYLPPSSRPTMSLGLDTSASALHRVEPKHHRSYPPPSSSNSRHRTESLSMRTGGGLQFCMACKMPVNECRCCRRPVRQKHINSAVLARCKNRSCNRQAVSNRGYCEQCISVATPKQSRSHYFNNNF